MSATSANTPSAPSPGLMPEQTALRGDSPFTRAPSTSFELDRAPRALRALSRIIDSGLCHRCGSCLGICPTAVLGQDPEGYPRVQHLSSCTDCDLCVKVCPGDEFDFPAFHQQIFQKPADINATHGTFLQGVVGYAVDSQVRTGSTSGGIITALLLHLLDTKQIDGAVVVVSDDTQIWKGKPILARTRAEILASMKSKYAIVPTNAVYDQLRETPGRYAVVGLPCQIHGFRKAAALDARVRERVVLSIGLFCHAAIEHEAFQVIWESLGSKKDRARKFISRIGKHPGTPHIELDDGTLYPVYFGNRHGYRPSSIEVINVLYRLYTPTRCTTCFDGLSEFADISVGDPWMAPPEPQVDWYQGWSFALLRTECGRRIYQECVANGSIHSLNITEREALASNRLMATEKRARAFRVIETRRRQGKPIPVYGDAWNAFPSQTGVQFIKTEVHMLTHIFCFLPRYRAQVLRFFLGKGYWLFWLNGKRRALRTWIRDTSFRLRTKFIGRR